YYVDVSTDVVTEGLGGGTDKVFSRAANFTLGPNVEDLKLLDLTFIVGPTGLIQVLPAGINGTGNSLANNMEGNAVANVLQGLAGNDTLSGLAGNDTLDGGTGTDTMSGGFGDDTFIADTAADTASENAGEGTD